jgi:hypothetical protein
MRDAMPPVVMTAGAAGRVRGRRLVAAVAIAATAAIAAPPAGAARNGSHLAHRTDLVAPFADSCAGSMSASVLPPPLRPAGRCSRTEVQHQVSGSLDGPPMVPTCVRQAGVNDRCESWSARSNGYLSGASAARPMDAVSSPKGDRVYLVGFADVGGAPHRYLVATNPTTGALVWAAHSPTTLPNIAASVAVSPNGATVYVTGYLAMRVSLSSNPYYYWYTEAYSAATGRLMWASRYQGVGGQVNYSSRVVVSPHGDSIYVLGAIEPVGKFQRSPIAIAVVAYAARSGKLKWSSFYQGDGGQNIPLAVAIAPRGDRLYVAAQVDRSTVNPTIPLDYAALALRTSNGAQLWVHRYRPVNTSTSTCCSNQPFDAALDHAGRTFVLTGASQDSAGRWGVATVAYATSTGRQLWVARYLPAGGTAAGGYGVKAGGDRFFVTGVSQSLADVTAVTTATGVRMPESDAVTIAYSTAGKALWSAHYQPQGSQSAAGAAVTVSPSGKRVYVAAGFTPAGDPTGQGLTQLAYYDAVVAYDAASGATSWVTRYDVRAPAEPDFIPAGPHAVVANPNGKTVTVVVWAATVQWLFGVCPEQTVPAAAAVTSCRSNMLVLGYPS